MALAKFLIIKPEAMIELHGRGISYNVSLWKKISYIQGNLQLFGLPEIFHSKHSNFHTQLKNLLAVWLSLEGKGQENVLMRTKKGHFGILVSL